jgi:uncharacterized RDD family membrane protein YckC
VSHSAAWPPQPLVPAGFGTRTVAYLVDAILLSFVGGAFPYLVISNNYSQSVNSGQQVTMSFALCFVGVIWVAFDPRHQGWHDKLARTLVVRTQASIK